MARRDSGRKAAKGGKAARGTAVRGTTGRGTVAHGKKALERKRRFDLEFPGHPEQPASDEWPLKTNVLFKPERSKYVRKQIETKGCVFCEALKQGVTPSSLVLFADAVKMVIMNKYPYNPGHVLVLPRRHEGELNRLSKSELNEVFEMVQHCTRILKDVYRPAGFNVGLNLGSAAGAGIPEHLHAHVVPRWSGDTNFFPLIAQTKVVVETLEQTYDRLVPYFDSLQKTAKR